MEIALRRIAHALNLTAIAAVVWTLLCLTLLWSMGANASERTLGIIVADGGVPLNNLTADGGGSGFVIPTSYAGYETLITVDCDHDTYIKTATCKDSTCTATSSDPMLNKTANPGAVQQITLGPTESVVSIRSAVAGGATLSTCAVRQAYPSFTNYNVGTNSGDVTIGTANGLSIVGQIVSMAAAGLATTGAVTSSAQTFGGAKTFSGGVLSDSVASATAVPLVLSSSVVDSSSAIAITAKSTVSLANANAKLFSLQNNGTEKLYVDPFGDLYAGGEIGTGTNGSFTSNPDGGAHVKFYDYGTVNNSGSISYLFQTGTSLSVSGGKIMSVKNGGSEVFSIDKDGVVATASSLVSAGDVIAGNAKTFANNTGTAHISFLDQGTANVAAQVAYVFDTSTNINGATAKVYSWRNGGSEKMYLGPANGSTDLVNALVLTGGKLVLGGYTDSTGSPGSATANTPTGRACVATGASTMTVTNSYVTSTSDVILTPRTINTTVAKWSVVPASGSFAVATDANPTTSAWCFAWAVYNH